MAKLLYTTLDTARFLLVFFMGCPFGNDDNISENSTCIHKARDIKRSAHRLDKTSDW